MIGIITFHRAVNYGAVLQCYALQQTLFKLGIDNEVIDYRCKFIEDHYSFIPSVAPWHIKQFLKECIQIPSKYTSRKRFDYFIKKHVKSSLKFTKKEYILNNENFYSCIITGSDQVWNLAISGCDTTYLLDFADDRTKKVSYAASLGPIEIEPNYYQYIKKNIANFDVVSLREPAAVDMIDEMYNNKINIDVDPTVLLDINDWDTLANNSKLNETKFIFVYLMQDSDILREKALRLSKEKKLKILYIGMVNDIYLDGKNMKGATVEDFLWMIKNSEYVVTNSFHGIMFSLLFEKKFYWAYQNGKKMSNPRFEMLNQYYNIEKCCCNKNSLYELDYGFIKKKMESQRRESLNNLKKYLLEK